MPRHLVKIVLIVVSLMIVVSPVYAVEFQPLGFEPMSMGGAGVASARGSSATYYNPALLAVHEHGMQVELSVGGGIREINVARHIDALADANIMDTINRIANNALDPNSNTIEDRRNITTIKDTLRSISVKNGIQLFAPSGTLSAQMGTFGFGAYLISEATAYAVIDPQRLDLIVKGQIDPNSIGYFEYNEVTNVYDASADPNDYNARSIEYALDNKLTYLKLTGLAYHEIFLSHARTFTFKPGALSIGAAFKIMPGCTFDEKIAIDTESGEIDNEIEDRVKRDNSWGVDLGFLYRPKRFEKLSLGLVMKNINTPEFETAYGDTLKVKPQVRTGLKYDLWKDRLSMAIDMDLTNNSTFVPGYKSQYIGGGFNLHPCNWFCIRTGAMQNMQDSEEGTILTGGIGLGLKWLQLDVAAQLSTKKTVYDREKFWSSGRVQVSLVSKWR
ncbi:MAG: conjugal transfer protein TraF [bacterium]